MSTKAAIDKMKRARRSFRRIMEMAREMRALVGWEISADSSKRLRDMEKEARVVRAALNAPDATPTDSGGGM